MERKGKVVITPVEGTDEIVVDHPRPLREGRVKPRSQVNDVCERRLCLWLADNWEKYDGE